MKSSGQSFSLALGLILFVIGVLGFVPAAISAGHPTLLTVDPDVTIKYGDLLGLFPVNHFISGIQIVLGLAGILASIALDSARSYARVVAVAYLIFGVMGFFPFSQTFFGLTPLFGSNVFLHLTLGTIALYFGFVASPGLLEISKAKSSAS
ncbi:MAG: DUF4383 domain-containing protein [Elainellaceae cyanobacterium]